MAILKPAHWQVSVDAKEAAVQELVSLLVAGGGEGVS